MDDKTIIFDINGSPLKEGDAVKFLNVSVNLLKGLPSSDKSAIQDQVNKTLIVQSFDEYGYVELEFTDIKENPHFIWVESKDIRKL